ncbi:hypothetical protein CPT_Mokit_244 [Acinetobacter phage Mokit]|nr:hypothetical protein CPT_Mokit_244 [Acinetobacter phage Mokit]QQO96939.1 hypothetical protein CPT_Melin_247 [Acinetobacter phage Melin]
MKKFIKRLLSGLAWWVLEDEIRDKWIWRGYFNDYTKWMSRDFPVMEDMYEHFKDVPYGGPINNCKRRQELEGKYNV